MLKNLLSPSVVIVFASALLSSNTFAATKTLSADEIMNDVAKKADAKDEEAKVAMTVTEANGSVKTRELDIKRKSGKENKVLVRINSPNDLRGTGFLSVGSPKTGEEQWLYLPSSKQTRRLAGGNKQASFLDSELSYEDMGSSGDKSYTNKILRTETVGGVPYTVIESDVKGSDSNYSKLISWVNTKDDLINKVEYYDKKGTLLKTTEASNYKQFPGGVWRAQTLMVKNQQNQRGTKLELKDLKVNSGIPDQEISVNALSEE